MLVPNTDGQGGQTIYSRTASEFGYTVRQVSTNAAGEITFSSLGWQETLVGEVRYLSLYRPDGAGNFDATTLIDGRLVEFNTQSANGWAPPQLTVTDLGDGLTERRITLGSGVELASVRDDDRRVLRVIYQRDDTDSTGEPRRTITTENRNADGSVDGPVEDLSLRQTDSGDGWRMPVASKPRCSRRAARSGHRIHFAIHSKKRPFDAGYGVKIP